MIINKLMKAGAVALFAIGLSATASNAVTVVADGGTYTTGIGQETQFIGEINALGGGGSWSVLFESTNSGATEAMVTIGNIVASTFTGLTLSWINESDNSVLASTPITPIETSLESYFSRPSALDQRLMVSWTDSLDGAGFDIEVSMSPVPLPFAGALLLSGIAGLGILRRRQVG